MSEIIKTKVAVDSKILSFLVYDRSTKVLEVFYKHGKYKIKPLIIKDVEQEQYDSILASDSIGRAVERLRQAQKEQHSFFGWLKSRFKGYYF